VVTRATYPAGDGNACAGTAVTARTGRLGGKAVLEAAEIGRAVTRIAHEIIERAKGAENLVVLGIPTRGVALAGRLAARIEQVESRCVPYGSLDITRYRDDLLLRPARPPGRTDLPPGGIDGKTVVLVDDVLYSGRTVRAALDALNEHGRPRAVQLAVLVDRGHRELPIRPDYVGKNLPTSQQEQVWVLLREVDGEDSVLLAPSGGPHPDTQAATASPSGAGQTADPDGAERGRAERGGAEPRGAAGRAEARR
jgi:pyrimidine operon attenuation protein / uracil phosphoribosyltransferase